jgi:hypothetical protein
MKIKSIDYEIEPINDFLRIVIFEEENKFKIGLSLIGNFGTDSFGKCQYQSLSAFLKNWNKITVRSQNAG